jgi:hypothetical protein
MQTIVAMQETMPHTLVPLKSLSQWPLHLVSKSCRFQKICTDRITTVGSSAGPHSQASSRHSIESRFQHHLGHETPDQVTCATTMQAYTFLARHPGNYPAGSHAPASRALFVPAPRMPNPSNAARATPLSESCVSRESVSISCISGWLGRSTASASGTAARTSAEAYERRCSNMRVAMVMPSSSPIATRPTPSAAGPRCAFCIHSHANQYKRPLACGSHAQRQVWHTLDINKCRSPEVIGLLQIQCHLVCCRCEDTLGSEATALTTLAQLTTSMNDRSGHFHLTLLEIDNRTVQWSVNDNGCFPSSAGYLKTGLKHLLMPSESLPSTLHLPQRQHAPHT